MKKLYKYALILIVLTGIIFSFKKGCYSLKKITESPSVTCGVIIYGSDTKGGGLLEFEYHVDNKKYSNKYGCTNTTLRKYRSGKINVLVVYEKNNPKNSLVVEDLKDFYYKYNLDKKDTVGLNCY